MARAHFRLVYDPTGETFVFAVEDSTRIDRARRILAGEGGLLRPSGIIVTRPVWYNPGWSFHYAPDSVSFNTLNMEVCDASIAYVEEHLAEVGGAFLPGNRGYPWAARLLEEVQPATGAVTLYMPVCLSAHHHGGAELPLSTWLATEAQAMHGPTAR